MAVKRVLKIRSKRIPHALLGISIPKYMHEYMTLYVCAKGITKSRVVRQFVDDWYKTQRITETDDKLVAEIATRMIDNYRSEFEDKDYPFEQYKKDMEADLQASSLKRVYIDMILAQVAL